MTPFWWKIFDSEFCKGMSCHHRFKLLTQCRWDSECYLEYHHHSRIVHHSSGHYRVSANCPLAPTILNTSSNWRVLQEKAKECNTKNNKYYKKLFWYIGTINQISCRKKFSKLCLTNLRKIWFLDSTDFWSLKFVEVLAVFSGDIFEHSRLFFFHDCSLVHYFASLPSLLWYLLQLW